MRHLTSDSGATLVEALVAAALLVTVATGTAALILHARQAGRRTEQSMAATSLALARLEALAAVPWEYDFGGGAPEPDALSVAPPDALDRNLPGRSDITDAAGRPVGSAGAETAHFAVRWAAWNVSANAQARALEVCVFPWPASLGALPIVCLASARVRQP